MYYPKFQYTQSIVNALLAIEKFKTMVDYLPLPPSIEDELRNSAKIKVAHYSTKIEGNPLDLQEASKIILQKKDRKGSKAEQEFRNYWNALTFLTTSKKMKIAISENFIKRLHSIVEVRGSGRRSKQSEYRGSMPPGFLFAVRDSTSGQPVYLPPEYKDVPSLMSDLVKWLNSNNADKLPVSIKAAIAAYQLLTIHPFEDGNGRTARALATYILGMGGYDLKGFNSMEEYYVEDLQGYYKNIQMGLPVLYYNGRNDPNDLAPWIEYFVGIMAKAFEKVATAARSRYEQQIDPRILSLEPKDKVVLKLLIIKGNLVTPKEIANEFSGKIKPRTVTEWAKVWVNKGLIEPGSGTKRVRAYKIGSKYSDITLDKLGYIE